MSHGGVDPEVVRVFKMLDPKPKALASPGRRLLRYVETYDLGFFCFLLFVCLFVCLLILLLFCFAFLFCLLLDANT